MRNTICVVLATLLFGTTTLEARVGAAGAARSGQEGTERKLTPKERILEIQPGTMIEVKLLNKQKLRGRLGEITDEGFSLQTAQGNKIETQKIAFNNLKSFKTVEGAKAAKTAGWIVLGALAGVGVLFLVLIAALRGD